MKTARTRNSSRWLLAPTSAFCLTVLALHCDCSAEADNDRTQLASKVAPAPTVSETPTLAQLRQERVEVAARRAEVTSKLGEVSQSQGADWLVSSLQYEINQLKFFELTLAQQEVLLENKADLEKQLDAVSKAPALWVLDEIDEAPPYSFLLLEQLRDDHADVQTRHELFEMEIDTAIELLEQAKQDFEEKQRERRRLRETLLTTRDSGERVKMERQFVNAELICRIFERVLQLRKQGLEVKRRVLPASMYDLF